MKGLLIAENGEISQISLSKDERKQLSDLQAAVKGSIQMVPHSDGYQSKWIMYVNEEGRLWNLSLNRKGQELAKKLGFSVDDEDFHLVGPVVLLGQTKHGGERGLTTKELDHVKELFSTK